MKKLSTLSAAVLIGAGALASTGAEARDRSGAVAAGVVGGFAAGALVGAASNAYAAPAYDYGYGVPAYGYGYPVYYGYGAPVARTRVVRYYDESFVSRPVYRTTRVARYAPARRVTRIVRYAPAAPRVRVVRSYGELGYAAPVATTSTTVVRYGGYAPVSYGYRWGAPAYWGW